MIKVKQLKNIIRESIKELINEQTYQQTLVPGTRYRLRGCDEMTGMMSCLPDSFFGGSPVPVGHTFTLGFPPQPGNQGGIKNVYVQEVVAPCQWYVPSPNTPLNAYPVNIPTEAQIAPGPLDSCPNNPNAIISDPVDPDPVDESFTCYGCVNGHISPFQNAQNVGYLNSPDENGVCGTIPEVNTSTGPVNNVTYYLDENHPQLENCGAEGSFGTTGNYTVFDYPIDNETGEEWNPSNWTANFIDMIINHPNPCNFLTQRITQFNTQLTTGNVGPLQANLLMQKIAVCQELYQMIGCGGMNEQISGVKKYKLDPKAAAVIKRMASKLRGLASRGRGGNRLKELAGIK